jgi:hypothetical protein
MIFQAVEYQLEIQMNQNQLREMSNAMSQAINISMKLMRSKTIKGFLRQTNEHLKKFMDFDMMTCMFADPDKDQLYTIELNNEKDEMEQF